MVHWVNSTILILLFLVSALQSQVVYTKEDSLLIYKKLDQIDLEDFEGRLDNAVSMTRNTIQLCRKKGMKRGEGFALLKLADLLVKKTEYSEINQLLNDGFVIGISLQDSLIMGLSYHQRAQYFRTINDYPKAIESLESALAFYSKAKDSLYVGICYVDLGFLNDKQGKYVASGDQYLKALRIFEAIGDEKETANTLVNLAICQYRLNDKVSSVQLFKKALIIQERIGDVKRISATLGNLVTLYSQIAPDSAIIYQEHALDYAKRLGTKNALAQAYANTGTLLLKQKKFEQAGEMYLKAKILNEELGDLGKVFSNLISCADLADKLNDSIRAEMYFNEANKICFSQQSKPMLQNLFQAKALFYRNRNNFNQAYSNMVNSYLYRDSMIDEKTKSEISELNLKYETEKKEFQLAKLTVEQKQKALEIDRQKQIIRVSQLENQKNESEIVLLEKEQELKDSRLTEMTIVNEKQELINRNNEQSIQLLEQNKLLQNKEIHRKNNILQFGLAGILLSALLIYLLFNRYSLRKKLAEQEALSALRNHIARDLHDEIGSTLTSINILSKVSSQHMLQDPQQSKSMLDLITEQSKTIQQNMSDIVWAIRTDTASLEALTSRMSEFAAKTLEAQGIQVLFNIDASILDKSLSIEVRKEILLIFKEVINNIIKHSDASKVEIGWIKNTQGFELNINDNGQWKGNPNSTGTGMKSIRQRAALIGGKVDIRTGMPGTEVRVFVPFA